MKKHVIACIVCAVLCMGEVYALDTGNITEKTISISGKTDANTRVSATVSDAEGNYYFYDELQSDKDGNYVLKFELPEDIKNKTISVEVKPQGKAEETTSFEFSGSAVRKEAIEECVSNIDNTENLSTVLSDADYKTAFENEGIAIDVLNANPTVKAETLQMLSQKNVTAENFVTELNRCFFASSMKNSYADGAKATFDGCGFEFDGVAYSKETDPEKKKWVKDTMLSKKNIKTTEIAETEYDSTCAYYILNNAKYSEIPDIIEKYPSELGLVGTSAYKTFNSLSETNKYRTAEKVVKNPLFGNMTDGFASVLQSSLVTSNDNDGGGGTSGGTSGGSSSGSSGSSGSSTTYPSDSMTGIVSDKNTSESTLFNDVQAGAWYKEAVEELYEKGIVSGKGDKTFAPNDNVTREEFAAMLIRAIGGKDEAEIDFTDVVSGAWYESTIKQAVAMGLTSGYGDGRFGIGDLITRQDAAVFASRAAEHLGRSTDIERYELFADDNSISEYAKDSVYAMKNGQIISGMGNNTFCPTENCTRAQAAVIVSKLLKGGNIR